MEGDGEGWKKLFFIDVQARWYYLRYDLKELERKDVVLPIEKGDLKLLKENTVDFMLFRYYSSRLTSADQEVNKYTEGNVFPTLRNPYLKASVWGGKLIH